MPELLPVVVNQTRIICTRDDWLRMDREDAVKKDCRERRTNPPKLTTVQKQIINQVTFVSREDPEYINRFRTLLKDQGLTDADLAGIEYNNLDDEQLESKIVSDILKANPSISKNIENKFSVSYAGSRHDIIIGTDRKVKSISVDGKVLREDQIDQIIERLALAGKIPSIQLADDYVEPPEVIEPEATQDFEKFDPEDTSASAISAQITKSAEKRKESISKNVPPRPDGLTMGSIFGGKPLSGEDIDNILAGRMSVPKNLRPGQWDELFGDTHDPETGRPLSEIDESETVRQIGTEDNPVDLKNMTEAEAREAYDKLKIGEYFINPFDGRVLPKR